VLERLETAMPEVELRGDDRAVACSARVVPATEEDFATEFLGLICSVAVVDDLDGALAHIARYGTGHSEAIVAEDADAAQRFLAEVDAAAVLHNASTRFVDGSELGLGAEVGISTQKLHARGPMGLEALTSVRWVIQGEGQTRT
jgi:glutamate-5-semialdehyde dehydrogenase